MAKKKKLGSESKQLMQVHVQRCMDGCCLMVELKSADKSQLDKDGVMGAFRSLLNVLEDRGLPPMPPDAEEPKPTRRTPKKSVHAH